MKINFNQSLAQLTGGPLNLTIAACPMCGRPTESRLATLRGVCADALVMQFQDERNLSGEEKVKRYNLALRITNEDIIDLSPIDIALIQELVVKMYSALIVGQVVRMLDPKEKDS